VPQFDSATWLPQLVWLAAIFAVLYFAVIRPTLPKVGRVIDEREGRVAGDLDAAEAAKAEADAIRTRYDDGMAEAREAAQARVAAAQAEAGQAAEARMQALAATLDAQAGDAAARLGAARDAARATLAATTIELTGEAVQRLTGLALPAAEIAAVLAAQE
jgi:F-type H+-transporting ATPase subunit b